MKSVAFALAGCAALLCAQPPIRVATRLVEVNVVARSAGGSAVDLTKEDFRLFDQGKEQKIAFFLVNSPPTAQTAGASLPPNRPDSRSAPPTSATVILLDGVNTSIQDQMYARRQFIDFLKQIRPDDHIAVYALGLQLRVLNDFTSDARSLLASLSRYSGDSLPFTDDPNPDPASGAAGLDKWLHEANAASAEDNLRNRVGRTVAAMQSIANHIGRLPGRKNLIWITGSFPFTIGQKGAEGPDWNDIIGETANGSRGRNNGMGGPPPGMAPGDPSSQAGHRQSSGKHLSGRESFAGFDREVRRATRALSDANIAVYPVDARGLVAGPKSLTALAAPGSNSPSNRKPPALTGFAPAGFGALQAMAESTGGRAFYNTNDVRGAIRAALDDAERTYTLGFYPAPRSLDFRVHDLKVRIRRKEVAARYRKSYLASAETPPADEQRATDIRNALWSPLESIAIAFGARLDAAGAAPRPSRILMLSIEPGDLSLVQQGDARIGELDVIVAQRSADGRDLGTTQQMMNVSLDPGNTGLMVTKTVDAAPDASEIRVILFDRNSGKLGSLTIPVA